MDSALARSFVVLSALACHALAEIVSTSCINYTTYGYAYLDFFEADRLRTSASQDMRHFRFEFFVKASSDAHVLLKQDNGTNTYEIVLGSGNNKFSQVRFHNGKRKIFYRWDTPGVVSKDEYRGFWVNTTTIGLPPKIHHLIQVGKLDQVLPLFKCQNEYAFGIGTVAFSTWTSVMGKWIFGCNNTGNLTSLRVRDTGSQRLRYDLLSVYTPNSFPEVDGDAGTSLELHMDASHFSLNERTGELFITGSTDLKWKDRKLAWNETEYDGVSSILLSPFLVWTPNIHVINSIDINKKSLLMRRGAVYVTSRGELRWKTPFTSTTICQLGYVNWPFDEHNCSLLFGFLTEPIKIGPIQLNVSKIQTSEWEILTDGEDNVVTSRVDTERRSVLEFRFKRRDPSIVQVLILPSFVSAAALSLLSFWTHPQSLAKLFLNSGSVLILALTLNHVGDHLPVMMTSVPQIVRMYSVSILLMCVPILLFVAQKYIPSSIALPRFMVDLINHGIVSHMCCLPEYEITSQHPKLREEEERHMNAVRLTILIERFVFVIYCNTLLASFLFNAMVYGKFF